MGINITVKFLVIVLEWFRFNTTFQTNIDRIQLHYTIFKFFWNKIFSYNCGSKLMNVYILGVYCKYILILNMMSATCFEQDGKGAKKEWEHNKIHHSLKSSPMTFVSIHLQVIQRYPHLVDKTFKTCLQ